MVCALATAVTALFGFALMISLVSTNVGTMLRPFMIASAGVLALMVVAAVATNYALQTPGPGSELHRRIRLLMIGWVAGAVVVVGYLLTSYATR